MADKKTILDEWKELISKLNDNVDKSLEEVRGYKRDIEKMKVDIMNQIHNGQYIRDDDTIVISAPRIIIGNVNKDGNLKEELGEVIIRGHALQMDAVGENGTLAMHAPTIEQAAIDAGLDGRERVVRPTSSIKTQARSVLIDSQSPANDASHAASFLQGRPPLEGITLSAESGIYALATPANKNKKKKADDQKNDLQSQITKKKEGISFKRDIIDELLGKISDVLKDEEKLKDDDLTGSNILALDELQFVLKDYLPSFNNAILSYASLVSELAELTREQANMTSMSQAAAADAEKYKKSTEAGILLQSENIALQTKDGDGAWRTNEESGIDIHGSNIKIRSTIESTVDHAELLPPDNVKSGVTIHGRNVDITTADLQNPTFKDGKLDNGQFPVVGNVTIKSKIIDLESVDLMQTDANGKLVEEKLTEGSQINMRAEKVRVKTIDHEGKSVGKFSVNSQKISMKATNIDGYNAELELDNQGNRKQPASLKSKELATGSEMLLLAEKIHVGYKKDKMRSKELYIASEEKLVVGAKQETTVATDKAQLNLKADAVKLIANGASTISAASGVTVKGDATFKGKVIGGDVEAKNIKASSSLTAPNIGDGMAVPGAPAQADQSQEVKIPENNDL